MKTLVLLREDVRRIVLGVGLDALMDEMIERLTLVLRQYNPDETATPARQGFSYMQPVEGLLEWMPCLEQQQAMIKVVGYHPLNRRRTALPTVISTLSTYDTENGRLLSLMDGTFTTALRTGAASAVATSILSRSTAEVVGIVGAGTQAVTQLHAMTRVLNVKKVLVFDIDRFVQLSYADRVAGFSGRLAIEPVPLEEIVERADVICTATSVEVASGPLFEGLEPQPWCHFNAIGSDFPGKTELPLSVLRRSFVCPDFREQAVREGECQQLPASDIGPELYELVQQPERFAEMRERLSVFDSTGWALEDQVAQQMMVEHARRLGLGTYLPIEVLSADALNPYDFALVHLHPVQPGGASAPFVS